MSNMPWCRGRGILNVLFSPHKKESGRKIKYEMVEEAAWNGRGGCQSSAGWTMSIYTYSEAEDCLRNLWDHVAIR